MQTNNEKVIINPDNVKCSSGNYFFFAFSSQIWRRMQPYITWVIGRRWGWGQLFPFLQGLKSHLGGPDGSDEVLVFLAPVGRLLKSFWLEGGNVEMFNPPCFFLLLYYYSFLYYIGKAPLCLRCSCQQQGFNQMHFSAQTMSKSGLPVFPTQQPASHLKLMISDRISSSRFLLSLSAPAA